MADLFSSTTRDVQRVLANSRRVARRHRQKVLTPDHLLLGLLQLSGSQAEVVLKGLQVNLDHLQARLEARLKIDARERQAGSVEDRGEPAVGYSGRGFQLSTDAAAILEQAQAEASENHLDFVDTRLLVLGMLRCPQSSAGQLLGQYGLTPEQFREAAHLADQAPVNLPRFQSPDLSRAAVPIRPSPIFLALLVITAVSGYLAYAGIGNPRGGVFLFVTGAWVVSVALHEFGHALVAFLGGDESVVHKGYLTLNPLKYTHPVFSILVPLLFLFMGGIGLPGGAVYINPAAIRKSGMRALASAAGPLATLLCGVICALPFLFGWHYALWEGHEAFWAGLGFLLFLQIMGLCLNLLPLPGLDGFGIMEPFLAPEMVYKINMIRPFSFFLLFALLSYDTPISQWFWDGIWQIAMGIDWSLGFLVSEGYHLFRFWAT
jgi:Zn-dependent protease